MVSGVGFVELTTRIDNLSPISSNSDLAVPMCAFARTGPLDQVSSTRLALNSFDLTPAFPKYVFVLPNREFPIRIRACLTDIQVFAFANSAPITEHRFRQAVRMCPRRKCQQ